MQRGTLTKYSSIFLTLSCSYIWIIVWYHFGPSLSVWRFGLVNSYADFFSQIFRCHFLLLSWFFCRYCDVTFMLIDDTTFLCHFLLALMLFTCRLFIVCCSLYCNYTSNLILIYLVNCNSLTQQIETGTEWFVSGPCLAEKIQLLCLYALPLKITKKKNWKYFII